MKGYRLQMTVVNIDIIIQIHHGEAAKNVRYAFCITEYQGNPHWV